MRWIGIDWSGRLVGEQNHIWTAVAEADGVHELRAGRTRAKLTSWLLEEERRDPELVVGFDFAFGLPAWFLDERGLGSAPELWAHATDDRVARWLTECPPPFWGAPGRAKPPGIDGFRETDRDHRAKSVFQIGGAGAVGTGSLRGWPTLLALRAAGFSIWPFELEHRLPLVVELYPRLFTPGVVKSDWAARGRWLDEHQPGLPRSLRDPALASEDAFDALASAAGMAAARLTDPGPAPTSLAAREGWIWRPPSFSTAKDS